MGDWYSGYWSGRGLLKELTSPWSVAGVDCLVFYIGSRRGQLELPLIGNQPCMNVRCDGHARMSVTFVFPLFGLGEESRGGGYSVKLSLPCWLRSSASLGDGDIDIDISRNCVEKMATESRHIVALY
jgi:hypothetical protein